MKKLIIAIAIIFAHILLFANESSMANIKASVSATGTEPATKTSQSIQAKPAVKAKFVKTKPTQIQEFIQKIERNNTINFIISLLPLLLIFDALLLFRRKEQKKSSKFLEYISLQRRVRVLLSVSLLAFGLLVFVPWSVYFGNSLQFPFIFQDFVNWNLRMLTVSIVGASIVLLLIPPKISDYLVAAIAGLGLCVYVQAMFMNQHLGTMDGGEPIWSEHSIFGTINLIMWIVIFLIPIVVKKVFPSYFSKIISTATGIVFFLEYTAVAFLVVSAGPNVWSRKDSYYMDGSTQFHLSKKSNVVVFIFDSLGSGFIKGCFEKHPGTKDIVKDFIWYEEARSNYWSTFPGLTHELTGCYLPAPANHYYELLEKMWHSKSAKSFYKQMKAAGYDARYYGAPGEFLTGPKDFYHEYYSNIVAREITYEVDHDRLCFCLKQISGFSAAPYFFKKYYFYSFDFSANVVKKHAGGVNGGIKRGHNQIIPWCNDEFVKKMFSSGIVFDEKQPILVFHYLRGVHPPYINDEKCNRTAKISSDPIPSTRGCFYILSEYIRFLKEAGVYDNTAILVCSDHGGVHTNYSTPYDMSFMIKPFNANKTELSIVDSKVQSIDILPTLLKMTCGDKADLKDFDGIPSFDVPADRVRKVYRWAKIKELGTPDPNFARCYPKWNGFQEYIFVDVATFNHETKSNSFVRQIPLVTPSRKDK